MKIEALNEIYQMICESVKNDTSQKEAIYLRKKGFSQHNGLKKVAFDTRKINQGTDYIPRRGLKNYHRSEQFISEAIKQKVASFTKLSKVLEDLKEQYGREPAWQDSYTRILHSTVNKNLNLHKQEFSDNQPSMASLGYLEELLYVRYRLNVEDLEVLSDDKLKERILEKDELLVKSGISFSDISKKSYNDIIDGMIQKTNNQGFDKNYEIFFDKMLTAISQIIHSQKPADDSLTNKLFNVKANKDAPEIERTVVINIKDKIVESKDNESIKNIISEDKIKLSKNESESDKSVILISE